MKIFAVSGSRNPEGQTARALDALVEGVVSCGGSAEKVFLPQLNVQRCRQCEANGWGICRSEGACVIEDDFAGLVAMLRDADVAVFATPVYFSDLSESLRAFLDRLRRVCMNEEGRNGIKGKKAIGICVAGGSGGGAPNCAANLDGILTRCGFTEVDIVPIRRQNIDTKCFALQETGKTLV